MLSSDFDRLIADGAGGIAGLIWILVTIVLSLAVLVRRLHCACTTGLWALIGFVPLIGGIVLLIFTVLDAEAGENKFWESSKVQKFLPNGTGEEYLKTFLLGSNTSKLRCPSNRVKPQTGMQKNVNALL